MPRRRKPRVGDWCIVHWMDAISIATWVDAERVGTEARCPDIISRGCLLVDTARQIILASTFSHGQVGEVIGIPRGMVVKMERTEEPK